MKTERIRFDNGRGDELSGSITRPAGGEVEAWALFAHCFTCGKDLRAAREIAGALAAQGLGTLRFDFTGLGRSEGAFVDQTFSANVDDLVAAAAWLEREHAGPQVLIGHSLGGAAVVHAAARIPSSRAVVTIGAPCDPAHVGHLLGGAADEIARTGSAEVDIGGRPFRVGKAFVDDLRTHTPKDVIKGLRRALLVMHSPVDRIVGVENARDLYTAAMHPKSFLSLDGADHLLGEAADARYAGSVLAAWASRYLVRAAIPEPALDPEGHEVVVYTGTDRFRTDVLAHGHRLVADEPKSLGGTDLGTSPYGLLVAGLGACTSMTLRMYADRKKWPLEGISVRMSHDKIHADDCEACETPRGKLDRIRREIELEGPLDAAQKARLLEIADKCPVHKTLHSEVIVQTRLKG